LIGFAYAVGVDPLFSQVLAHAQDRPQLLKEAETALETALRERHIYFGDHLLPTVPVPYFVPRARIERWAEQTSLLAAAIEAIATAALGDRKLFDALKLRPDAQPLLAIDPGYEHITVLSRADALPVGDELVFLEFNCDSPAMMTFADGVTEILLESPLLKGIAARLRPERLTSKLLDCLLVCYRSYRARGGGGAEKPTIAIVDWEKQKTRFEHQRIARAFDGAGYPTVVCDPRALRLGQGRSLELDGRAIDLVYRRALFTEILDRQGEVEPLLTAYREGRICMVNPLRSYLASSKTLLATLCGGEIPGVDAGCRRYIARSAVISPAEAERLRGGPRKHVLKRGESHGGQHVLLPDVATEAQWQSALDAARTEAWIMQEYHPIPTMPIPSYKDGRVEIVHKLCNWNPFLFGGEYAGGIVRASSSPLINISLGGGLLPTMPYE
jgi:glutathionylspermidine synthase